MMDNNRYPQCGMPVDGKRQAGRHVYITTLGEAGNSGWRGRVILAVCVPGVERRRLRQGRHTASLVVVGGPWASHTAWERSPARG
jgi:hypothetical protein